MLFSDGRDTDDDSYCHICVLSPERLERSWTDDTTGWSLFLRATLKALLIYYVMK